MQLPVASPADPDALPPTPPAQPAGHWRLRLLGGFALGHGGAPIVLPATAQRLVAYVALHGPTDRARAAWSLWAARADGRALADLRTALWRLRKAAPGLLPDGTGQLALAPQVQVDIHPLTGSGPLDLAFLRQHADQGCPELLPGWYDDWVAVSRELLRHRALRGLEHAADAALRAGDPATALIWALQAVTADCLRESAHRLVLTAMLADGNVADAVRHADLVTRLLAEQLGVRPSAQLSALIGRAHAGSAAAADQDTSARG